MAREWLAGTLRRGGGEGDRLRWPLRHRKKRSRVLTARATDESSILRNGARRHHGRVVLILTGSPRSVCEAKK
jgi:hypothetical protein